MKKDKLSLFEGFGVELEYMIVNADTLAVLPIADKLIHAEIGKYDDVERGPVAWSNELVSHVIEIKSNGPAPLEGQVPAFQKDVQHINNQLKPMGAMLLPTAMHPWMDPHKETKIWPHDHNTTYEAFNRIFDCKGHGWSNLQSAHLNLPFADDNEFGQLHAAVRLLLPILPALAASSPIMDGKLSGMLDNRLHVYRNNAMRIPSVTGQVIPETGSYTRKDYEMNILARIYQDLSTYDTDGILQHEWVNARGAIARFERSAIEIRLLDIQECPQADVSIAALIVSVLKVLMAQRWMPLAEQKTYATQPLAAILRNTIGQAHEAVIDDEKYLKTFNFNSGKKCTAGELWQHLVETVWPASASQAQPWREAISVILQQGPLARRIVRAVGRDTSRDHMKVVYRELAGCLQEGKMFRL